MVVTERAVEDHIFENVVVTELVVEDHIFDNVVVTDSRVGNVLVT